MEAEVFATFAADARGFLFWPFRQHSGGSEQPHGAVVSPWGAPTIGYRAAEAAGTLLEKLRPLLDGGEAVAAPIAITYSDRARTFMSTESGGKLDYRGVLSGIHHRFVQAGIRRGLLPESAPLEGLKALFTPYVHHLDAEFLAQVTSWVQSGGTWVVGPGTGDRDMDHGWRTDSVLGAVEPLAGVRGVYHFPATGSGTTGQAWGWEGPLSGMSTFVETTTARALGTVISGPAAGLAFITENSGTPETGAGRVIVLGSLPDAASGTELLDAVIEHVAAEVCPRSGRAGGNGVVEYQRRHDGRLQRWLVNMGSAAVDAHLPQPVSELLSNVHLPAGKHRLEPYAYIVTEEQTS